MLINRLRHNIYHIFLFAGAIVALIIILSFATSQTTYAATINVLAGDVPGLIAAINTANTNGEDDIINLAGGTYSLTVIDNNTSGDNGLPSILPDTALAVDHTITINGTGATIERNNIDCTTLPTFRIFHVATDSDLTLNDLTIQNGCANAAGSGEDGGAIFNEGGAVTISNSTLDNNYALNDGGAIHNQDGGVLTIINNSILSDNYANANGGAISNEGGGTAVITDCDILNNTGDLGGGAIENNTNTATTSTMTISNCDISGNVTTVGLGGDGGAIRNLNGDVTITNNSTLDSNYSDNGGGAIAQIGNASTMLINGGTTLSNNVSFGDGGAVSNTGGTINMAAISINNNNTVNCVLCTGDGGAVFTSGAASITNVTGSIIDSNTALENGGGFHNENGARLTITGNTTVSNNTAIRFDGGAINCDSASILNITSSTLDNNLAARDGGAIMSEAGSTVTITNSGISNNSALSIIQDADGGAISNDASVLTITSSTLDGNQANDDGGAIHNNTNGIVIINDSNLTNNTVTETLVGYLGTGGAISNLSGNVTINTSTLSGNTVTSNTGGAFGGAIYNQGTLTVTTSTLSGNNAATNGDGIWNNGTATVNNSTLFHTGQDTIFNVGAFNLYSSIVASNNVITTACTGGAAINDNGFNMITDASCNGVVTPEASLAIGPLQNNGGFTNTHLIGPGSAAIDQGNCVLGGLDQRGATRTDNLAIPNAATGCDVGAVEVSAPIVQFLAAGSSVSEFPGGPFTVTVTLTVSTPTTAPITVTVFDNVLAGNAIWGSDYTDSVLQFVTFPAGLGAGVHTQTITLTIFDDLLYEGVTPETVVFDIVNILGGGAVPGTILTHTVDIIDNELIPPVVEFQAASSSVNEPPGGPFTVTVTLTNLDTAPTAAPVAVTIDDTLTGDATSGPDYTYVVPQTVIFPAGLAQGVHTLDITLGIINDLVVENTETVVFGINVASLTGLAVPGTILTHTVSIIDDDVLPPVVEFQVAASSVSEFPGGPFTVTVTLTNSDTVPTIAPVSVTIDDLLTGDAASGSDYSYPVSQTVTFPAGLAPGVHTQTITLGIIDDTSVETTETVVFQINVGSITGGALAGTILIHTVSIIDNDAPTPITPTVTPEPTDTPLPTDTPVPSATNTLVPTSTPIPTNTLVPTNTTIPTGTLEPTSTLIGTGTVIPTGTTSFDDARTATNAVLATTDPLMLTPVTFYIASVSGPSFGGEGCVEDRGVIICDPNSTPVPGFGDLGQTTGATTDKPFILKNGSPLAIRPGMELTYTLRIINPTNQTASNVSVNDTVPNTNIIISVSSTSGTASFSGQEVTFNQGSLAAGGSITITILTRVRTDANLDHIINTACLISSLNTDSTSCATMGFSRVEALPGTGESPIYRQILLLVSATLLLLGFASATWYLRRQLT
jgi:hypothetical protein